MTILENQNVLEQIIEKAKQAGVREMYTVSELWGGGIMGDLDEEPFWQDIPGGAKLLVMYLPPSVEVPAGVEEVG